MFSAYIKQKHYHLDHAALLMAKEIAYDELEAERWLAVLDALSQTAELRLRPTDSRLDMLKRLSQFLFEEEGFHGNTANYYDPRNSFLNDVLLRHIGIPITLSVLFIAVARRIGLPLFGVGLPGHFIVACRHRNDTIYLDPFHDGLMLSEEECEQLALNFMPEGEVFSRWYLKPQSNDMVLVRMLNNLRQIYLARSETAPLLRVLQLQQALVPTDNQLNRDIGIIYVHLERWGQAIHPLRQYLYQCPDADDADTIRHVLHGALNRLSELN